ncbi:MAG: DUF1850 domain-containing protein [Candidatus Onthomonas sp.]
MKRRKICLGVAAAVLLIAVALFGFVWMNRETWLVLRNLQTEEVYARYPIQAGEEFSIEFKHSVNKTPVRDVYQITEDGQFHNIRCIYYGFGAGVQTQLEEGETLSYQDGAMIIDNIQKYSPQLTYSLLSISTHVLRVGEEEVFLPDLIDGEAIVAFTVERHLF